MTAPPAGRTLFLVLKAANLAVITAYSFELIYVLVRSLSAELYPAAVLISSLGVYVMATDLGYSGFVYFRTRQSFIDRGVPHGSEAEVFMLYVAVALAAALLLAAGFELFSTIPAAIRCGLSLYFLSMVLALPWGLLRRVAAAVDLYVSFEAYELGRRLFFFAAAATMLAGVPLAAFALACLLAWGVAFAAAVRVLWVKRQVDLSLRSPLAVHRHVRSNYRHIAHSGSLTLAEFVIYNFLYLTTPILFADAKYLVAFDIFYKVIRFGGVSYSVAAEAFLPSQTRAFYAGDRARVVRGYLTVLLLGLAPFGAATAILFGAGDRLFTTLLSRAGVVSVSLRASMAVMLAAMLVQSAAGTFLLGTGHYRTLSRLAAISLALMAAAVVGAWWLGAAFDRFMAVYVAIYAVHTAFYTATMLELVRSMKPGGARTLDGLLHPNSRLTG